MSVAVAMLVSSSMLILALPADAAKATAGAQGHRVPPGWEPFIERMQSSNATEQAEAMRALSWRSDGALVHALPLLIQMLGDERTYPLSQGPSSSIMWFSPYARTMGERAAILLSIFGEPAVPPLLETLRDGAPSARADAIRALAEMRDVGTENHGPLHRHLLAALTDENAQVRANAARAIGARGGYRAQGDARVFNALMSLLSNDQPHVRAQAAFALGSIRDPRAVEALIAALAPPSAEQIGAARKLDTVHVAGRAAVLALQTRYPRIAFSGEHRTASFLLRYLKSLDNTIMQPTWGDIEGMLHNAIPEDMVLEDATIADALDAFAERANCRWLARVYADGKIRVSFRDQRTDAYTPVREAAARALTEIGGDTAVTALIGALDFSDQAVRLAAVHALAEARDPRVVMALIGATKDEYPRIRAVAAVVLGSRKDPRAFDVLVDMTRSDPSSDPRSWAIKGLGLLGDPRAVDPLLDALHKEGEEGWVRGEVIEALGKLGGARAVEPVLAALRNGDYSMRLKAIRALGELGDVRAVGPLIEALMKGENIDVKRLARTALTKITGIDLGEDAEAWLTWLKSKRTEGRATGNRRRRGLLRD